MGTARLTSWVNPVYSGPKSAFKLGYGMSLRMPSSSFEKVLEDISANSRTEEYEIVHRVERTEKYSYSHRPESEGDWVVKDIGI
jgi:hypothetical protein